jgi:hypothetical protein
MLELDRALGPVDDAHHLEIAVLLAVRAPGEFVRQHLEIAAEQHGDFVGRPVDAFLARLGICRFHVRSSA